MQVYNVEGIARLDSLPVRAAPPLGFVLHVQGHDPVERSTEPIKHS